MTDNKEIRSQERSQEPVTGSSVDQTRRRLTKAGLAAPVIMSLASRPALANTRNFCTISGWGSVHPSGRPEDHTCEGRSPGFWKTYWAGPTAAAWALSGFNPGPTNPITGDSHDYSIPTTAELNQAVVDGVITSTEKDAYIAAITVASTFDQLMGSPTMLPDNVGKPILRPTIMQVFHDNFYKQYLPDNAAWHYAASLLNAAAWGHDYGYTLAEMRTLISERDGLPGFVDDLKGLYDRY
ncbi:MAG: hypothetical protein ABW149_06235 [Sedimenticola sp.]